MEKQYTIPNTDVPEVAESAPAYGAGNVAGSYSSHRRPLCNDYRTPEEDAQFMAIIAEITNL